MRNYLARFDTSITQFIQSWPQWLELPMVAVTFLGQPFFTVGIAFAIAAYGFYKTNERLVLAGSVAAITFGVCSIIKIFLKRDRPATEYVNNMFFDTFSFPSGHATGAMVSYGLLAYLAWTYLPAPWNIIGPIVLSVLIALIGISRVFLGAHYPSDVIGGWLLGALGLFIIIYYIKPVI